MADSTADAPIPAAAKPRRKATDEEKLFGILGAGTLLAIDLVWIFGYPALIILALAMVVLAFIALISISRG